VETSIYKHNWHIDAIADHLTACLDRQIRRLIINLPPRHQKSLSTGVFFPAWTWALPPVAGTWRGSGTKFLSVSHKAELAERDAMLSRRVIESPWYQRHWSDRVSFRPEDRSASKYRNTAMGYRLTGSFGAGILGEGGDIIIVDDPHPTMGITDTERMRTLEWYSETLKTRLNDPMTGVFIVVMQRLHSRDLTGHILATESGWDHLCLPAEYEPNHPTPVRSSLGFVDPRKPGEVLWPERFSKEALDGMQLSEFTRAGQLQQRPVPREGGLFKREWFDGKIIVSAPEGTRWVRHWDLAGSTARTKGAARTAGVKVGRTPDGRFIVAHATVCQEEGYAVRQIIRATAEIDGRATMISLPQDPGQAGKTQARDYIAFLAGYVVKAEPETGDKVTRAEPFASQAEAGNVYLVRGSWNEAYLDELCLFPGGAFADQVDATAAAFSRLLRISRERTALLGTYGT
jgi:predicted phage terminase large subunit-like protein